MKTKQDIYSAYITVYPSNMNLFDHINYTKWLERIVLQKDQIINELEGEVAALEQEIYEYEND